MTYVRRLRDSEVVAFVVGVLQAIVWLAGLTVATSGVCAWFVAVCWVDWAILNLGDSPIATAAIIGGFVVGACVPGTLLGALWSATKDGLRNCLDDLGSLLEALIEEPSPVEETERECVEEIRKQSRIGLQYVEQIVQQLRSENTEVTILALYNRLRGLADKAEDPEWLLLDTYGECLFTLVKVPAEEAFDRAVAQGACPVKLLEEILGC